MTNAKGLSLRLDSLLRKRTSRPAARSGRSAASQALLELIRRETLSGLADFFGRDFKKQTKPRPPDNPVLGDGGRNIGRLPPMMDQRYSPFDQRQLEISIDQMVASSLMHGRQTSGVLRALFGLVPSLIGR